MKRINQGSAIAFILLYYINIFLFLLIYYFNLQYKTERDGIVETRVEQKITIQSDGDPIDHDKALAEAIQVYQLMLILMLYQKFRPYRFVLTPGLA